MEIKYYDKPFDKFKGLMFKKDFNYGIRLRSNGIHTFFMKECIDVYLTDRNYKVLYVYKCLKPNKIVLPKKSVFYTYEFPLNKTSYKIGDKIET